MKASLRNAVLASAIAFIFGSSGLASAQPSPPPPTPPAPAPQSSPPATAAVAVPTTLPGTPQTSPPIPQAKPFAEVIKGGLHASSFTWPEGGKKDVEHKNGDKCGDQAGEVKAFYDGKPVVGDPANIRLTDKGVLVLAFVPKDTTAEKIGDPPSKAGLSSLSDVTPTNPAQSQTTAPGGSVTRCCISAARSGARPAHSRRRLSSRAWPK